ncbi:unnamed protein product [Vitrella brassicaformis CCMP3155]|uniref:Membrane insertase YidC/Oxa/ALB C-terminal domain-containing protein n=2 Tax=Vitrella brassicaformis TaxID=1169539 RepID=A0A0G4ENP9_VITBC|nr:unnamed protein product [Vitrella brassicaformis CCMP3155]|mmetsp:Transcript_36257/g.90524  ORF Transcript_36257/g.90524 Transcript_36257/m.90524 type:complete len:487 (+) Transcript_36257:35-1495(+)|eukprot:CEL98483.1 unnamed protein product [Vitrella brassicaformis CCMP3155]
MRYHRRQWLAAALALCIGLNHYAAGFARTSAFTAVNRLQASRPPLRRSRPSPRMLDPTTLSALLPAALSFIPSPPVSAGGFGPVMEVLQGVAQAAGEGGEAVGQAVQTVTEEVAKEPGWWDNYVSFLENMIYQVHHVMEDKFGIPQFGWAIIVFTVLIRIFVFPITWNQMQGTQKIQALNPVVQEIKKRFGKNQQIQTLLTAQLYQEAKVNPLASILPAFVQIPIFLGLYRSLSNLAKDGQLSESFLWIPNLEGPTFGADPAQALNWLTTGWDGSNPPLGWEATLLYLTVPVIYVISQYISQAILTPPAEDEQSKRVQELLKYLPFLIGYFALSVPSALVIYWIASNVLVTAISWSLKQYFKSNPIEYDIKLDDIIPEELKNMLPTPDVSDILNMSWEDLLKDAQTHAVPPRASRRPREDDEILGDISVNGRAAAGAALVPPEATTMAADTTTTSSSSSSSGGKEEVPRVEKASERQTQPVSAGEA